MSAGAIVLIILGAMFVLGGGSCVLCLAIGAGAAHQGAQGRPAAGGPVGASPSEQAMQVPIGSILTAYKGNEIAADNSYKGRLVEITGGFIGDVKKDVLDEPYLIVGTGAAFEFPAVQCSLRKDQINRAATLQKGARIIVRGRVHGLLMHVQVEDCEIL